MLRNSKSNKKSKIQEQENLTPGNFSSNSEATSTTVIKSRKMITKNHQHQHLMDFPSFKIDRRLNDIIRNAVAVWRRFTVTQRLLRKRKRSWLKKWRDSLLSSKNRCWRNEIRAVVHRNYWIYTRAYSVWVSVYLVNFNDKRRWDMAVGYGRELLALYLTIQANILLARKAFDAIMEHKRIKSEKKLRGNEGRKFYCLSKIRTSFQLWQERSFFKGYNRNLNDISCAFEARYASKVFFQRWQLTSKEREERSLVTKGASLHYCKHVTKRVFIFWLKKSQSSRSLCQRLEFFEVSKEILTLTSTFAFWLEQLSSKRRLGLKYRVADTFRGNYLLQFHLNSWKLALESHEQNSKRVEIFLKAKAKHLLTLSFSTLLSRQRELAHAQQQAQLHSVKHYLMVWKEETERQCELHYLKSFEPGRIYHSRKWKCIVFSSLVQNWRECKTERVRQEQALSFYLKSKFISWRMLAVGRIEYKHNIEIANTFRTSRALERYWHAWKSSQDKLIKENILAKKASRHYRKALLTKSYLCMLKESVIKYQLLLLADDFHKTMDITCLKLFFWKWVNEIRDSFARKEMERNADTFRNVILLKMSWLCWEKTNLRKRQVKMKIEFTNAIFEQNHVKKHFYALLNYTRQVTSARRNFARFNSNCDRRILAQSFKCWDHRFSDIGLAILDSRMFNETRLKKIAGEYIKSWKEKTKMRKHVRDLTILACIFESQKLLAKAFDILALQQQAAKEKTAFLLKGTQLYHAKSLKCVFVYWLNVWKHKVWVKANQKNASQKRNASLMKYSFKKWKSLRSDWRAIYRHSHVFPLAICGLRLCKSYFEAWKSFISVQKQLKADLDKALIWRKQSLIDDATRRVFEVAQRVSWEAQARSGLSEREVRLGLKYGTRWRYKSYCNSRKSKNSKPSKSLLATNYIRIDHLNGKKRPSPRLPDFLILPEKSRLKQYSSQPPIIPVSGRSAPVQNVVHLHENPLLEDNASIAQSNTPILIAQTSPILPEVGKHNTQPSINMEEEMNYIQELLLEASEACKAYLEHKSHLAEVEGILSSYVSSSSSENAEVNFGECLELRQHLHDRVEAFESKKDVLRREVCGLQRRLDSFKVL